jgi:hypothetical protein
VAKATASAIEMIAAAIDKVGGEKAVALKLGEQYIEAFSNLAKESNTILLPAQTGDPGSMVAQALSVFNAIQEKTGPKKD